MKRNTVTKPLTDNRRKPVKQTRKSKRRDSVQQPSPQQALLRSSQTYSIFSDTSAVDDALIRAAIGGQLRL